jgi:hypothetical protein
VSGPPPATVIGGPPPATPPPEDGIVLMLYLPGAEGEEHVLSLVYLYEDGRPLRGIAVVDDDGTRAAYLYAWEPAGQRWLRVRVEVEPV